MSTLTKNGVGNWKISGTNTYTGLTTINAGTLKLDSDNTTTLGTAAGGTIVNSGAVLDLNGKTLSVAEPLTLNGTGLTATPAGALTNTGGNASYSGNITLGAASTITATTSGTLTCSGTVGTGAFGLTLDGAGTGTMSGVISTPTSLTKSGAGTWTLSGTNTYTGATLISAGVLKVQNAQGTGTTAGGVTVSNGAALALEGGITVGAEALTLSGGGPTGNAAFDNISGNNTWGGAITLGADATIRNQSNTLTISGTVNLGNFILTIGGPSTTGVISGIISGTGSVRKVTPGGVWTLSGANTYTGATTINAGTLKAGVATSAFGVGSVLILQ